MSNQYQTMSQSAFQWSSPNDAKYSESLHSQPRDQETSFTGELSTTYQPEVSQTALDEEHAKGQMEFVGDGSHGAVRQFTTEAQPCMETRFDNSLHSSINNKVLRDRAPDRCVKEREIFNIRPGYPGNRLATRTDGGGGHWMSQRTASFTSNVVSNRSCLGDELRRKEHRTAAQKAIMRSSSSSYGDMVAAKQSRQAGDHRFAVQTLRPAHVPRAAEESDLDPAAMPNATTTQKLSGAASPGMREFQAAQAGRVSANMFQTDVTKYKEHCTHNPPTYRFVNTRTGATESHNTSNKLNTLYPSNLKNYV